MRIALLLLALALAGCSTPYQGPDYMGDGVSAQRITSNTFKIVVRGNAITSGLATQDYTALKAAETAKQAGGTHFVFISGVDASSEGPVTTGGKAKKPATSTAYPPTTVYQFIRPGQDAYIRVLTVEPGQPLPSGSFSAEEMIRYASPRVRRPVL
jgi:hypothetical protein